MTGTQDWVEAERALVAEFARECAGPDRTARLSALAAYARAVVVDARARGPIAPTAAEAAAHDKWLGHPVFICGHHRSGTTLLQELLDAHPQLVVLPSEATYFTSFRRLAAGDRSEAAIDAFTAEWIVRFADPHFAPHFRLGTCNGDRQPSLEFARRLLGWHAALWPQAPRGFAALLALVSAYASVVPAPAPARWVEKTPLNEWRTPRLRGFEDARFIHVVRDPAPTFTSLRGAFERGARGHEFDAAEHARAIGRSLRAARRNRRRMGPQYLVVRYEDLVTDVEGQMRRVAEFLGIAFHPGLVRPTADGGPVAANSSFEPVAPGVIRPVTGRAALDARERRHLDAFAGRHAAAWGYCGSNHSRAADAWHRITHAPRLWWRKAWRRLARPDT